MGIVPFLLPQQLTIEYKTFGVADRQVVVDYVRVARPRKNDKGVSARTDKTPSSRRGGLSIM
jgi:hypothetical protein